MRRAVAVLLSVLVTGCAMVAPPPAKWAFRDQLNVAKKDTCDTTASHVSPQLGSINAFGLAPHMQWLPGGVLKINWEEQQGSPHDMDLELRRPGGGAAAYRLHREAGPSLVSFPEPGCWDLTVRTSAESGATRLYLEPARSVGILVARGNNPDDPDMKVFEWKDETVGLQLLDAAAGNAGAPGQVRRSAQLWMVWQAPDLQAAEYGRVGRILTPLVYMPGSGGEGAQVLLQKSLVTGDCRDLNVPVAVKLKPELAGQIEKALGSYWLLDESAKEPWRLISADCTAFAKP